MFLLTAVIDLGHHLLLLISLLTAYMQMLQKMICGHQFELLCVISVYVSYLSLLYHGQPDQYNLNGPAIKNLLYLNEKLMFTLTAEI